MKYALFLAISLLFAGCPPPCPEPGPLSLNEIDEGLLGTWEGFIYHADGGSDYATIDFTRGVFFLEVRRSGVESAYIYGTWRSGPITEEYSELEFAIGCNNLADRQEGGYTNWFYSVEDGVFMGARKEDYLLGIDSPERGSGFYVLERTNQP